MPFSDAQNENAKRNSAKAARAHHNYTPPDIDWDAAIARLQKMFDSIEAKKQKKRRRQ